MNVEVVSTETGEPDTSVGAQYIVSLNEGIMSQFFLKSVPFGLLILIVLLSSPARAGNWEALFTGNGDVMSYIYFHQDIFYFIDTDLSANLEAFRYKKFFFGVDLFEETNMGRKYHSNMVFDPNRGQWSFGISGRIELEKYFFEAQFHHDCFHHIGRWKGDILMPDEYSVYWNTPRIGFGSLGYLPKYKYHQPESNAAGISWPKKLDYYVVAGFFAPRGAVWQKNHDYEFTMNINLNFVLARYKQLGFTIESNNLWVINTTHQLKRQHGLNFDFTIYGSHGTLMTYIGWWPYDNQSLRPRNGKTVFGMHIGF